MEIIRDPECHRKIGVSRMTRDRREKAGLFPRRVRLGRNSVGWVLAEVEEYLEQLAAARYADEKDDDEAEPQATVG